MDDFEDIGNGDNQPPAILERLYDSSGFTAGCLRDTGFRVARNLGFGRRVGLRVSGGSILRIISRRAFRSL
jgi:hypothetical protein